MVVVIFVVMVVVILLAEFWVLLRDQPAATRNALLTNGAYMDMLQKTVMQMQLPSQYKGWDAHSYSKCNSGFVIGDSNLECASVSNTDNNTSVDTNANIHTKAKWNMHVQVLLECNLNREDWRQFRYQSADLLKLVYYVDKPATVRLLCETCKLRQVSLFFVCCFFFFFVVVIFFFHILVILLCILRAVAFCLILCFDVLFL
jgi:hypothetical protein